MYKGSQASKGVGRKKTLKKSQRTLKPGVRMCTVCAAV